MSRLSDVIRAVNARGEKACGIFVTSGFPHTADTLDVLRAVAAGGADFIELGMPFSDPVAEGLPIQRSSERALAEGIRMQDTLATAAAFRATSDVPLVLMGYMNPVYAMGPALFCRRARESGVDGLILPDLPPQESELMTGAARAAGLDLIFLAAPNTADERIRQIDALSSGFVYAVSITGVTGTSLGTVNAVEQYLERARACVRQNPLLVGFGIRTPDDVRRLTRHTDGFIVGSALVDFIDALWDDADRSHEDRLQDVACFIRTLKTGAFVGSEA